MGHWALFLVVALAHGRAAQGLYEHAVLPSDQSTWWSGAPNHFASVGCYEDSGSSRWLPDLAGTASSMTPAKCMKLCNAHSMFGMVGDQCYCGKTSGSGASVAASSCATDCSGDATYNCGLSSGGYMSVYSISVCSSMASCGTGAYQSAACTTTSDRTCTTCESSYYCPGDGFRRSCNTSASCGEGLYQTTGCSAAGRSEDRQCAYCGGCDTRTNEAILTGDGTSIALGANSVENDQATYLTVDTTCTPDAKYYCPGDGSRYPTTSGYYTIVEDAPNVNPLFQVNGETGDPNMRVSEVKCGDSVFYCTATDGLRVTVPDGVMTTGGSSDNTTRTT